MKGNAYPLISAKDVTADGCLWRVMQFWNPCQMPPNAARKSVSRTLREVYAFVALSVICFASALHCFICTFGCGIALVGFMCDSPVVLRVSDFSV